MATIEEKSNPPAAGINRLAEFKIDSLNWCMMTVIGL